METLTAIIRSKVGHADTVAAELTKVGEFAATHEPDTIGFFVAQDPGIPAGLPLTNGSPMPPHATDMPMARDRKGSLPLPGICLTATSPL